MRKLIIAVVIAASACGPRQVEVRTAPTTSASSPALQVTNGLGQAIMIYVVSGGTDMFIRQVAANSSQLLPVQGVPAGATVTLKAVTSDGAKTYSKANVGLSGTVAWVVP